MIGKFLAHRKAQMTARFAALARELGKVSAAREAANFEADMKTHRVPPKAAQSMAIASRPGPWTSAQPSDDGQVVRPHTGADLGSMAWMSRTPHPGVHRVDGAHELWLRWTVSGTERCRFDHAVNEIGSGRAPRRSWPPGEVEAAVRRWAGDHCATRSRR